MNDVVRGIDAWGCIATNGVLPKGSVAGCPVVPDSITPEPATSALMASGLVDLFAIGRRRFRS